MTIPFYIWPALASAVLMGLYSVAIKLQLRYRVCSPMLVMIGTCASAGMLSLPGLIILRQAVPPGSAPLLAALVLATAAAHLLLSMALQEGDASTVVPLLGLKIPFTAVLSAVFLREVYPPMVYAAVVLSAAAMVLFGAGRPNRAEGGRGRHPFVGIALAALSALTYSAGDLLARRALQTFDPWALILWTNTLVGVFFGLLFFLPRLRQYRLGRVEYGWFALSGLLLAGGIGLFFVSIDQSGIVTIPNIILAARGFVALAAGYALNRLLKVPIERQSGRVYLLRLIASVLLFLGLSLILLGGR